MPTPTCPSLTLTQLFVVTRARALALSEPLSLPGADAYMLKPLRMHELRNIWQCALSPPGSRLPPPAPAHAPPPLATQPSYFSFP